MAPIHIRFPASRLTAMMTASVVRLHRAIRLHLNRLGGGGGIDGFYGSMAESSLGRLFDCMTAVQGFGPDSVFFDFGAGVGV